MFLLLNYIKLQTIRRLYFEGKGNIEPNKVFSSSGQGNVWYRINIQLI